MCSPKNQIHEPIPLASLSLEIISTFDVFFRAKTSLSWLGKGSILASHSHSSSVTLLYLTQHVSSGLSLELIVLELHFETGCCNSDYKISQLLDTATFKMEVVRHYLHISFTKEFSFRGEPQQ